MSLFHVIAHYGPCETFHNKTYKPRLLAGFREYLHVLGYRVDLRPVPFENYCMIEMCGMEVFRCDIRNLKFNANVQQDPVCQRAVNAVLQSSIKFRRAQAYLWIWTLLEQQIFRRDENFPKDYWLSDVMVNDKENAVPPVNAICFFV